MTADVVVIGSGFAGLSAATALAGAGRRVVVAEQAPRLGGRATAFTDKPTGERVDNGQHVLFGCYRETFAFLARIGTSPLAPLDARLSLSMAGPDGRASTLTCPPWPPPWHLAAGVMRWRALSWRDRLSAAGVARLLLASRRVGAEAIAAAVPESLTVSAWLASRGQSPRLCEWLWNPLAIAALNQPPDVAAARPFVRVLAELFGPRVEDSAMALPSVPLDALYAEPAARFLEARGGQVCLRSPAAVHVGPDGSVEAVMVGDTRVETRAVVCAVPWHALGSVWAGGIPPAMAATVANANRMASSPIVTVNLWFDRPVMSDRLLGFIGSPWHWAFDKSAIFGEAAGHLSLVSSGADALLRADNDAATALAVQACRERMPAARAAALLRSVVVREPRSTFSLAPGGPPRPGAATALAGFFLAGDWTDTGLPATIEGAVASGERAARALLAQAR